MERQLFTTIRDAEQPLLVYERLRRGCRWCVVMGRSATRQNVQLRDRRADQVVRRRGARRQADRHRPGRGQPAGGGRLPSSRPTGRCRISSATPGSRDRRCGTSGRDAAQMRARLAGVAAVVAADHDHQVDRLVAQQRDDGVLPILRGAADRVERLKVLGQRRRRRSGRSSPPSEHLADLAATRTSASSSGWRGRCAAGRGRDRSPARRRCANRARNASRSPPSPDVVADDLRLRRRRTRPGSGRRTRPPATPSPASPRARPCRG